MAASTVRTNSNWLSAPTISIELDKGDRDLSKAELVSIINDKFGPDSFASVSNNGSLISDDSALVGSGSVITLNNQKSFNLVLFGDANGDGEIAPDDASAILNYRAGYLTSPSLDNPFLYAAADVALDKDVGAEDASRLLNFLALDYSSFASSSASFVDSSLLPDVESNIKLEVFENENPSTTSDLVQNVEKVSDSEYNLYVIKGNASGKANFNLIGDFTGYTFEGVPAPTAANFGTRTNPINGVSVSLEKPSEVAGTKTSKFTIKKGDDSLEVTVNVIDISLPSSVAFDVIRQDDVNTIPDAQAAVKANTQEVLSNRESEKTAEAKRKFAGNVNLMKNAEIDGTSAKFYRAIVKIDNYDTSKVVAVKKGTYKKYKTEKVPNSDNEIYIYLNADEASTDIVFANEHYTNAQIDNAAPQKVTFESTSKIWVVDARPTNDNSDLQTATTSVKKQDGDPRVIDFGVKFDGIKPRTLDVKDKKVTASLNNDGASWINFILNIANTTSEKEAVENAVFVTDNDNVYLDHGSSGSSGYMTDGLMYVWLKAEKEGPVTFTLNYNLGDNVIEKLPITVNLHDAATPIVKSVDKGSDANKNGVVLGDITEDANGGSVADKAYTINVDTYKYAMDPETTSPYSATKSRWYSLVLETNVDVSSLVVADNSSNPTKWVSIPERDIIDEHHFTIWLDRDSTSDKSAANVQHTIANRYALTDLNNANNAADKANKVGVNIKETEKSRLEVLEKNNIQLFGAGLKEGIDDNSLKGVTVKDIKTATDVIITDSSETGLQHNMKTAKNISSVYTSKTDVNTITYNLMDYEEIQLNGVKGRWVPLYFGIRDDEYLTADVAEKSVIVDKNDDSTLLTATSYSGTETKNELWDLVPVWFNLDGEDLQKYVSTPSKQSNDVLTITLHSTTPDETNTIKVKFVTTTEQGKIEVAEGVTALGGNVNPSNEGQVTAFAQNILSSAGSATKEDGEKLLKAYDAVKNGISKPEVTGDTVYMTVKADFKKLATDVTWSDQHVRIPMNFDISMLNVEPNHTIRGWSQASGQSFESYSNYRDIHDGTLDMSINFTKNSTGAKNEKGELCTDEIGHWKTTGDTVRKVWVFTTATQVNGTKLEDVVSDLRQKKASYVVYVVDFIQQ